VTKPPKPSLVSLGVIESKVTHKAVPPYPELAKRARASGPVTVQILLDEQGRVVSARATNGHPLLRAAAEQAAYQTRFSPTLLSNQPVKVSGIITFNFVLQ
jgi:TonB family protein